MKTASYSELYSPEDRLTARIAAKARVDTVYGGCTALVIAKRLKSMRGTDLTGIVADVYSASTGKWHTEHEAWECPECGNARLGQDSAYQCCVEELEEAA